MNDDELFNEEEPTNGTHHSGWSWSWFWAILLILVAAVAAIWIWRNYESRESLQWQVDQLEQQRVDDSTYYNNQIDSLNTVVSDLEYDNSAKARTISNLQDTLAATRNELVKARTVTPAKRTPTRKATTPKTKKKTRRGTPTARDLEF